MAMEVSHIWIGVFASSAFEDYFMEHYGDDEAPINRFAEEQGEVFYDHDWIEISYLDDSEASDIRSFVAEHSYSENYLDAVCERAVALRVDRINVFVIADKNEFDNPRSVTGTNYRLEYLGEFNCFT
ncbi:MULTISPECIES: immunity 22 family protein [unclassified Leptolyngbya]|jgi:hypothetical protein|uniref:immunity 22 family protein n=1 Tax=unclassified Leptolyngbya TaxID=2650499 RepID=UPI001682ABA0|nr:MULTISPECIES: immunity 22 family protein [unclassified Leptolyngbya]MBD1912964.1 immunity 22 family protein [Leptolyngbya sp. FACHB-8]MBD2157968.1 immunity 22 family protein [Leptolyngbya sp. FACHB-16]